MENVVQHAINALSAQWRGDGWGMHPGMMEWGYGMSWFWHILGLLFWVAVIVGIVFLIRWVILSTRDSGRPKGERDSALDILRSRYAKGEIDRQEFEEKKQDLLE